MADKYKQEKRVASVKIDGLTEDDLLLNSMSGVDKVGQPFKYTVEMLRNIDAKIDISKLVGKKLTISLKPLFKGPPDRYFNGYIADIRRGSVSDYGLERLDALVVPKIWFFQKSLHNRIFRNKSVTDILSVVFKSAKITFEEFEAKDVSTHPKLEHCVQYRETDYAFVHRLMEEYGISYYFEHAKNEHTMKLLDSSGKRPTTPPKGFEDFKEMKYTKADISDVANTIKNWNRRKQVVTDAFEQTDFDFANKDKFPTELSAKAEGTDGQGDFDAKSFEKHIYEPAFEEGVLDPHELEVSKINEAAEKIAKVRLGSYQAQKDIVYAESVCRGLHAGYVFKLTDYEADKTQNGEYYILAVHHRIAVGGYGYKINQSEKRYSCSITAIPKKTEYYPLRLTPKARIYGPQTATVVGEKSTDEKLIYTDKHGRVKVRFHWDRADDDRKEIDKAAEGAKDKADTDTKNLSCWIRVAQGWAGNKFGSFFLPRVGQEVIVEFLDGDPDRPIITGSVYNAKNLAPYKLNDHATISTIKSETVGKDGKKAKKITFNEIRFEDTEDKEQIFIHAGRSMDTRVLGDHREYVGCNMQLTIDGATTKYEKKTDESSNKLGRDVVINTGHDQLTIKKGNLLQEITEGNHVLQLTAGHQMINIAGKLNIKATEGIFISTDGEIHIKSKKSILAEATESIKFKAGKDITLDATGAINLNSKDQLLCKGASGIGLAGDSSTIDISANVGIKGGSNVVIKGSKVDINGGAPKSPKDPAAAKSPEDPSIKSPKDEGLVAFKPAFKEDKDNKDKAIGFGELK